MQAGPLNRRTIDTIPPAISRSTHGGSATPLFVLPRLTYHRACQLLGPMFPKLIRKEASQQDIRSDSDVDLHVNSSG